MSHSSDIITPKYLHISSMQSQQRETTPAKPTLPATMFQIVQNNEPSLFVLKSMLVFN
jgi:hypothetical protein